jgi:hypothetical protein
MAFMTLAACGAQQDVSRGMAYHLDITHPAPHASFLRIAPAAGSEGLPDKAQIKSPHFSQYLRARTGCVVNPSYPATALGDPAMPAAYMVPISCG